MNDSKNSSMQRILIIGNAGSGKSTFAKKLANKTKLPLVHLDKIFWRGDWEHLSRDAFDAILNSELSKPRWIIDGNFNRTIPLRLSHCDTVFFFDLPTVTCLWGITKRILTNYGKVREDMGGNCAEHFDRQKPALYKNVLTFNRDHRKDYQKLLDNAAHAQVITFKSRRQANKFLSQL